MLRLPPQTYNTTTAIWLLVNATATPADLQHYYYLENILTIPSPASDSSSRFLKPAPSLELLHHPRHPISLKYLALRRGTLRLGSQTNRLLIRIQEAIVGKFPNSQLLNPRNPACWLCHWLLIRKHLLLSVLRIPILTHLSLYRWSSHPGFSTSF